MVNHSLTLTASHIIRMYLWEKLQAYMSDVWKPLANGAPPIIPVQEQPEVQDSENPYMVYIYDTDATNDLYQVQHETLTLRMFTESPAVIAATGKLCVRVFNRWDETARDLNRWLHSNSGLIAYATGDDRLDKWIDEARNIKFLTVTVSGIQGAQPAREEGGRVDSLITIDMSYVDLDPWWEDPNLGLSSDNT